MKERIIGILLLFCLVAPFFTTFTFLHYQKRRVRREVKHQLIAEIDKSDLVSLNFSIEESKTKLIWKHSKEFEYNGQMYDIVEKETKGDTIYYWCWLDNKETKLNKKLDELLAYAFRKDHKQNQSKQHLSDFFKSLYCEKFHNWRLFPSHVEKTLFNYQFHFLTVSYPPPVPPPELA